MIKQYKCSDKNFPEVEFYLFSLEFDQKPTDQYIIIVDNKVYKYDFIKEFGKWRIITI